MRVLKSIVVGGILMASMTLSNANAQISIKPEIKPGGGDKTICRCKKGGCYGGSWLSFRTRCGQSEPDGNGVVILCSAYVQNCPPSDDNQE